MKNKQIIVLVVSNKVVLKNSKTDWPDLNYPGTGETILRTVQDIDYERLRVQLDGEDGPWFEAKTFPVGVGFYAKIQ